MRMRINLFGVTVALLIVAAVFSGAAKAQQLDRCLWNSDCNGPMACKGVQTTSFGGRWAADSVCIMECREDRDCARGYVCRKELWFVWRARAMSRFLRLPTAEELSLPNRAAPLRTTDYDKIGINPREHQQPTPPYYGYIYNVCHPQPGSNDPTAAPGPSYGSPPQSRATGGAVRTLDLSRLDPSALEDVLDPSARFEPSAGDPSPSPKTQIAPGAVDSVLTPSDDPKTTIKPGALNPAGGSASAAGDEPPDE